MFFKSQPTDGRTVINNNIEKKKKSGQMPPAEVVDGTMVNAVGPSKGSRFNWPRLAKEKRNQQMNESIVLLVLPAFIFTYSQWLALDLIQFNRLFGIYLGIHLLLISIPKIAKNRRKKKKRRKEKTNGAAYLANREKAPFFCILL